MVNNETRAMRKTFPLLFEKLDSLRFAGNPDEQRSSHKAKKKSKPKAQLTTHSSIDSDRLSSNNDDKAFNSSNVSKNNNYEGSKDDWLNCLQSKDGELVVVYV